MEVEDYLGATIAKTKFDGTLWRDAPITDITDPSGSATPDFITISRGGFTYAIQAYDGGNTTEYKSYRVEIPHDADVSKGFEVHFRATPTTDGTGNVKMTAEITLQKKGANVLAVGTKTATNTIVAGGNTAGTEYYFSMPILITDTNISQAAVGDSFLINIKRNPSDAADTYGADFAQTEFGLHYAVGSNGSTL